MEKMFNKYPNNEPFYHGVHYVTIVKYKNEFMYSITYYNDEQVFEPKIGEVVAFLEQDPEKVYKNIEL